MFPLLGEPLALDLVNTRVGQPDQGEDLLRAPGGMAAWLAAQEDRLVTDAGEVVGAEPDAILTSVSAVREHAAAAIDHVRRGQRPPITACKALVDTVRVAPAYRVLGWADGAVSTPTRRRDGSEPDRIAAALADATVDLLTDPPAMAAVRQCQADDCALLFRAQHPRRQWCSAARCGNRTRVARYDRRHKGASG